MICMGRSTKSTRMFVLMVIILVLEFLQQLPRGTYGLCLTFSQCSGSCKHPPCSMTSGRGHPSAAGPSDIMPMSSPYNFFVLPRTQEWSSDWLLKDWIFWYQHPFFLPKLNCNYFSGPPILLVISCLYHISMAVLFCQSLIFLTNTNIYSFSSCCT